MKDIPVSEEEQAAYFDAFRHCLNQAVAKSAYYQEMTICLAGQIICLKFTSEELEQATRPALIHLVVDDVTQVDHTISLWDSVSSGVMMSPPICNKSRFTDRGDIWGVMSDRYRFAYHYGEYAFYAYDQQARHGIFWVNNPAQLPYWSYASPLRTMFHWCMAQAGLQLLHAAAIGTEDGGVLLTGEGGIGKSTTALIGLGDGFQYIGDDYVVVGLDPEPTVYPLYSSAKTNQQSPIELDYLADCQTNGDRQDEKKVFQLFSKYHDKIPESMPLVAILVPNVVDEAETSIQATVTQDDVIRKASFTTVSQLPYSGKATYGFIERLSQALPGYQLNIGSDQNHITPTLQEFIALNPKPDCQVMSSIHVDEAYPSLSVIVPVYNREHIVREAMDNIVAQQYPNIELIVVNDGSTDKTEDIVKAYPYDIRYYSQNNGGPSAARNRGLINATGELVAFLDSDDIWLEGMLKTLVESLITDSSACVAKGYSQLARMNTETNTYEYEGSPLETFPDYITGAVFRKSVFDSVGLFDTGLKYGEDIDWFNRATEKNIITKRHDFTSVIIRRHDGNMTNNKDLVELNVLRVFKKSLDRKRQHDADPDSIA